METAKLTHNLWPVCGALATAVPTLPAMGQSSVTLYGMANAAVESGRAGKGAVHRVVSGCGLGSRLGLRGEEPLGDGISAIFRIEQGLTFDNGQRGQAGQS